MIRLDFGSMHDIMHLYQASLSAKFDSNDKSLLVSEPLANAIDVLLEALYQDARLQQNVDLEEKMHQALVFQSDFPQYAVIVSRFVEHADEIDWRALSVDARKSYLKLAARPFQTSDEQLAQLDADILEQLDSAD